MVCGHVRAWWVKHLVPVIKCWCTHKLVQIQSRLPCFSGWSSSAGSWWDHRGLNENMERGETFVSLTSHKCIIWWHYLQLVWLSNHFVTTEGDAWGLQTRRDWPVSLLLVHRSGKSNSLWAWCINISSFGHAAYVLICSSLTMRCVYCVFIALLWESFHPKCVAGWWLKSGLMVHKCAKYVSIYSNCCGCVSSSWDD